MTWHRHSTRMMMLSVALGLAGCSAGPSSFARLVGSKALDTSGSYRKLVTFDRGAYVAAKRNGSAILVGPGAAMMLDYQGYLNRFELLLVEDSQSVLYRRVDQRAAMTGNGTEIKRPIGIHAGRRDNRLEGRFDVMLDRVDLRGLGSAFEHYPKQMRVIGEFAIPNCSEPAGPTTQPAPFWWPANLASSGAETKGLGRLHAPWVMRDFAGRLPPLENAATSKAP